MVPIRVLFLCSGNSCRSQMAEAFLRRYGQNRFEAHSAGTRPEPLDQRAAEVMLRAGVDISAQRPKSADEFAGQDFDFVITVCDIARDVTPDFGRVARLIHWRFADPSLAEGTSEEKRRAYLRVRDEIAGRIRLFAYAQSRRVEARDKERAPQAGASPVVLPA